MILPPGPTRRSECCPAYSWRSRCAFMPGPVSGRVSGRSNAAGPQPHPLSVSEGHAGCRTWLQRDRKPREGDHLGESVEPAGRVADGPILDLTRPREQVEHTEAKPAVL